MEDSTARVWAHKQGLQEKAFSQVTMGFSQEVQLPAHKKYQCMKEEIRLD